MATGTKDEAEPSVTQTPLEKGSIDDAWSYLKQHHNEITDGNSLDLKALRRKVDWHIVPLMFGCYTMQFLDKVILNVSRIGVVVHIAC